MNEVEKKQLRGAKKKRLIAETALSLIRTNGYKNVTVDEIVSKCNTSKGSFYHHFNTKADILNEHFIIADDYYEKMYNSLPTTYSAHERLSLFLKNMFIYLDENFGQEFLTIVYYTSLESTQHTYFRNPSRKLFLLFEKLINEINTENVIQVNSDCKTLSQSLIHISMGIICYWCTLQDPRPLVTCAEPTIDVFLHGLS